MGVDPERISITLACKNLHSPANIDAGVASMGMLRIGQEDVFDKIQAVDHG